jgi:hypothetical protein
MSAYGLALAKAGLRDYVPSEFCPELRLAG